MSKKNIPLALQAAITAKLAEKNNRYIDSGAFDADIDALEPWQRLTIFERYLQYILPRQSSTKNETSISANVDPGVLDILDRLTLE